MDRKPEFRFSLGVVALALVASSSAQIDHYFVQPDGTYDWTLQRWFEDPLGYNPLETQPGSKDRAFFDAITSASYTLLMPENVAVGNMLIRNTSLALDRLFPFGSTPTLELRGAAGWTNPASLWLASSRLQLANIHLIATENVEMVSASDLILGPDSSLTTAKDFLVSNAAGQIALSEGTSLTVGGRLAVFGSATSILQIDVAQKSTLTTNGVDLMNVAGRLWLGGQLTTSYLSQHVRGAGRRFEVELGGGQTLNVNPVINATTGTISGGAVSLFSESGATVTFDARGLFDSSTGWTNSRINATRFSGRAENANLTISLGNTDVNLTDAVAGTQRQPSSFDVVAIGRSVVDVLFAGGTLTTTHFTVAGDGTPGNRLSFKLDTGEIRAESLNVSQAQFDVTRATGVFVNRGATFSGAAQANLLSDLISNREIRVLDRSLVKSQADLHTPNLLVDNSTVELNGQFSFGRLHRLGLGVDYQKLVAGPASHAFLATQSGSLRLVNGAKMVASQPFNFSSVRGSVALAKNSSLSVDSTSSLMIGGGSSYLTGWVTVESDQFGYMGVLVGSGTITGNVRNRGGFISPGFSPGKLTIDGDFVQESGELVFEIGGLTEGVDYDQIAVSGDLSLTGGRIVVELLNGFVPGQSDEFKFFTGFNSLTVSSDLSIVLPSALDGFQFDPLRGILTTTPVPEPATIGTMLLGLAVLLRKRRSRTKA